MRHHYSDVGYARQALLCLPTADPLPRWAEVCAHLTFEVTTCMDMRPLALAAADGVVMVVNYMWNDSVHLWSWMNDGRLASWVEACGPGTLPAFKPNLRMMHGGVLVYLNNRRRHRFSVFVAAVVRRCDALAADLEADRAKFMIQPASALADPTARTRQITTARAVAAMLRASAQRSIARAASVRRLRRRVHALACAACAFTAAADDAKVVRSSAAAADFAVPLVAAYLW
jgi:hypothetical protein